MLRTGLLGFVLMALAISCGSGDQAEVLPVSGTPPETLSEDAAAHYQDRLVEFARMDMPADSVIMLGDGTVEHGDWQRLLAGQPVVNMGIEGDTVAALSDRLDQALSMEPEHVFILAGLNDLKAGRNPDAIAEDVTALVQRIVEVVPASRIHLHTVLSVDPAFSRQVGTLNHRLKYVAYKNNIWFVHLDEQLFVDGERRLDPVYLVGKGQLSDAGYAVWAQYLQPYFDGFRTVAGTDIIIPAHYSVSAKTQYARRVTEFATREAEPGAIAFVGDSITEGADFDAMFPSIDTLNFGIGWEQTEGLLNRIDQIREAAPSHVVLLIGTNDIGKNRSLDDAAANIATALAQFKEFVPAQNIAVHTVMPRDAKRHDKVVELNGKIEAVAREAGVSVVDLYQPFLVDDHSDPELTRDGLHPNAAGYERWREVLVPWLVARGVPVEAD